VPKADSLDPTDAVPRWRSSKAAFRPDIEGLRAVAVVGVVLFHAEVPGVGGGFVGVDVFFVISGFLITGLLWREVSTTGNIGLLRFYGARARRLLPASATVGIVTMIASAVLLSPLQLVTVIYDGIASALYVGNMWFLNRSADYFVHDENPSPFLHYWSLGVEEQFYLLWPAMIIGTAWLVSRTSRSTGAHASWAVRPYLWVLVLVGAVSFALSLELTHVWPLAAFFSMPTRAWQFVVGGLVALTAGQWRQLPPLPGAIMGWVGLGAILFAGTRLSTVTPYPGTAALLPVLGTALVIGAGCAEPARGVGCLLALPPMRAVGRVSYSWYLWHWPVLVLAEPLLGHPLGLAGRLATAVISGGLAVLSLRFIENPLRFAPSVRRSATRSLALGGAATAVAVCAGVALLVWVPTPVGRGAPAAAPTITATPPPAGSNLDAYNAVVERAFGQVRAAVAASANVKAVPSNLDPSLTGAAAELKVTSRDGCVRNIFQVTQPECAAGDTVSPTTVALVGDSHAGMLSPALQQIAAQRRWRLETLAKGACPLLDLRFISAAIRREYTECEQWRVQVIDRLRTEHPRLVLLSISRAYNSDSGVSAYDPAWIDSLYRLVQQLRDTSAKVLVLGPTPAPGSDVPICLSRHLDDATACSPPRSTALNGLGIAAESAATKAGGGQYADLSELFCTTNRCPVIVGNILVYRDNSHLTLEYSRLLAPIVGALADRALVSQG